MFEFVRLLSKSRLTFRVVIDLLTLDYRSACKCTLSKSISCNSNPLLHNPFVLMGLEATTQS